MDAPFDILGPDAGWWSWSTEDPNIAVRWLGVPVTSYCWHLLFGGTLAALTRALEDRASRPSRLWLALPVALLTIVVGIVLFIPFHVLKGFGLPDGAIVAGLVAAALVITVIAKKSPVQDRDRRLWPVLILFFGYHLAVALVFAARGGLPEGGVKLAVIAAAIGFSLSLYTLAHRRAPQAEPITSMAPHTAAPP
uniref:Uncharacterized protein n=1 Tax=Phaselicystis flava TaxID=525924 RepID=A0A3S7V051_9BACT|nr:hypothetical protein [Phaselicystis flava]